MPAGDDPLERLAQADPLRAADRSTAEDRHVEDALVARIIASPPDSGTRSRRRLSRWEMGRVAAAALVVVIVLCSVVLADPFGDERRAGVVEQALAAVGDGPVLHVTTELDIDATLLDLRDGRSRRLSNTVETWYDPQRGLRFVYRVGGVVLADNGTPIGKRLLPGFLPGTVQLFTRDYRDALSSGQARVVEEGEIDGTAVYWIRVPLANRPRGISCRERRMFCRDVAVSRETYEPVYLDSRLGAEGRRVDLERIVSIESLEASEVAIPGPGAGPPVGFTTLPRRTVDRATAARRLGHEPLWPGKQLGGLELARVSVAGARDYVFTRKMKRPRYSAREPVVRLVYGTRADIASGRPPSSWRSVLVIQQAAAKSARAVAHGPPLRYQRTLEVHGGPRDYLPPAGKAVISARGHEAMLRRRGLAIKVYGSTPALTRAAVEALAAGRSR